MSEHTPGPWFVRDRNIGCAVGWIGKVKHDRMADGNFGLPEADAHLIAAAPTMYDYIKSKADGGDSKAQGIMEGIHGAHLS